MIDLHCHILPGIDDGAADASESIAMARQGAEDGIERICATPHIRHDHDVRIDEIAARVGDLNAELDRAGVPLTVLPGGEVAETVVDHLDDGELGSVALGDGAWVLLEPAPGPLSDSLERRVEELATRGFRALVAHPERHAAGDFRDRLRELIARGALIQATADFLIREDSGPAMLELAGLGLIHVLGSDAHSARFGRPARLAEALAALAGVEAMRPHLEWIGEAAPRAIVEGRPGLEPPFAMA